jgi:5-methylcytosine-specific restriction protein A
VSTHRVSPKAGWINARSAQHRGPNGRGLCRWCGVEVPPRRRTFCGDVCVHEWRIRTDPGYVRQQVERRDRGVCAECGRDSGLLPSILREMKRESERQETVLGWTRWREDGRPRFGHRTIDRFAKEHRIPLYGHTWEADHIVPVVEGGGECGLDGYRTLCRRCHSLETARLAKRRADRRKGQPALLEVS